jgi:hypothetical protein
MKIRNVIIIVALSPIIIAMGLIVICFTLLFSPVIGAHLGIIAIRVRRFKLKFAGYRLFIYTNKSDILNKIEQTIIPKLGDMCIPIKVGPGWMVQSPENIESSVLRWITARSPKPKPAIGFVSPDKVTLRPYGNEVRMAFNGKKSLPEVIEGILSFKSSSEA